MIKKVALIAMLLTVSACDKQGDASSTTKKASAPAVVHSEAGEAGRSLYVTKGCIGCHGPSGVTHNTSKFPALAGQTAEFISSQLMAFKTYQRRNPMMSSVAQNLEEADISKLAVYLSELPSS